ncbi:MAG: HIT family protein [Clostridia bacterium]|nr:HIT family protein [Clostridia bacterium]
MSTCIFCDKVASGEALLQNELAIAFFDSFPVSRGHVLIIPRRHAETFFDLTDDELVAMKHLAFEVKALLDEQFHPDGYNIGLNCREAGGQTVFHCHMHVIPRYKGDVPDPTGGVRTILPGGNYRKKL